MSLPIIDLKKIILRPITLNDYMDYYFIGLSYENTKYLSWGPFESPLDAKIMLESFYLNQSSYSANHSYAIEYKKTKEMIGILEFHTYFLENNSAEVGFILREDFHHQGIMTMALKELIKFGFNNLNYNKILIGSVDLNDDSIKLIKRFDFKYDFTKYQAFRTKDTFEQRNIIYYSMYKYEFEGSDLFEI